MATVYLADDLKHEPNGLLETFNQAPNRSSCNR